LPPLDLQNASIIDQLAVYFCGLGHIGANFQWSDVRYSHIIQVCRENLIPITASEFSAVLLAHGMPSLFQQEAERLFEFGIHCATPAGKNGSRRILENLIL